ncbi:MAG: hypothetical protein C4583_05880 [Anaerolineaceae bacterium]|nr:MAG: hypothetical protein C4583_05880 [Anaerolineaceae bacterium]
MKHLLVWMGIVLLAVLTLTSCGGGGGGGGVGDDQSIQIAAFDNNNVEPLAKLTITGTGFDPSADLTVNFFDAADFSLDVPVLEATASSVIVAVPPYMNISTGKFEPGTVSVRVLQTSIAGNVTSNTLTGLDIGALPDLTLTPGEVTANVAAFMELSLTDTINQLAELDLLQAGQFSTGNLRAQLEANRLQYGELKAKVRNAINNPDQAEPIGMINGVSISIDEESLTIADQLMVAMINETLAQLQVGPAALARSSAVFATTNVSSICQSNPDVCGASGQPLVIVKNYRTGEETAVEQYHYAMALPGARELLSKAANWFAATSATLGAVATVTGFGTPVVVVAAVTQVNIECMVVKYGLDAARLSANNSDKEAAKDLLEDFTGTLEYMRDSVLSPTIAAISEHAGVVYDLFTGWQPVVEDRIPDYLSQMENFIDTPAPTGNVIGEWSGAVNNPNLGRVGCSGGESYFGLSLDEDAFMAITGSYGSVAVSGSRTGNTMMINASTRFGNRSYTWTWDGNDTITGSVAYFCWSLETGQLLNEGTGTFIVTRY